MNPGISGIGWDVKDLFFDRNTVMRRIDKDKRRNLSKFGAFVRTRARSMLNRSGNDGKVVSEPGEPPRLQTGLLRGTIFFAFDRDRESVIIGPNAIPNLGGGANMEALQEGGMILIKRGWATDRKYVAARPFMEPAFEEEMSNFSKIWKSS